MRCCFSFFIVCGLLSVHSCLARAGSLSDGLYAEFSTSMGDFTCELDYTGTPRTVANFVQLAEGDRVWGMDLATGTIVSNVYYDGGVFHRVITNFMIQGGNPMDPVKTTVGFLFDDEFTTPSSTNVVKWVLAMANKGPDTNGAGFFVTVDDRPQLNGGYTVFGRVVDGTNVVEAISLVPTTVRPGSNPPEYSVPTVDIILHQVRILRIGADAQNWNPAGVTPPLPEPHFVSTSITNVAGTLYVMYGFGGGLTTYSFLSPDLVAADRALAVDVTWRNGHSIASAQAAYPTAMFWTLRKGRD